MAVSRTLATLGRFIRRTPPPPPDLLEAYAHEVIPVLDRAEWLYEYWLEQSMLFTDSEKLGNVAAIHRWETATMGRSLERVIPPAVLAAAHESVIDALEMASRAAQLLSSGSRFHNANAVCEGQAMLMASRERRLSALRSMRRYLSRVTSPVVPEIEVAAGPPPEDGSLSDTGLASPPGEAEVAAGDPTASVSAAPIDVAAGPPGGPVDDVTAPDDVALADADGPTPDFLAFLETASPSPSSNDGPPQPPSMAGPPTSASVGSQPPRGLPVSPDPRVTPGPASPADTALPAAAGVPGSGLGTPDAAEAPDAPSTAAPAPDSAPRQDGADREPPPRSGWGSLFGR